MLRRLLTLGIGVTALLVVIGQFGPATAEVTPTERTIYMAALEPKGGTTVDKEPFPLAALPGGGGYIIKEPNDDGRWEVATYRWTPGTVVVNQGDIVTLEIVGINGKAHPTTIEGYDVDFVVERGQVTRATFTADKAGIFKIVCQSHGPSMQADLVVLAN